MMITITGTPGCGKSTVAEELIRRGHQVLHVNDTIGPYIIGDDSERDTKVIDSDRWM